MEKKFEEVVDFHGHLCIDIALGFRVAKAALQALSCQRPQDEELVAVVENDSCSVDAVQEVTGCTFGKGNLVYKPYGKAAYTFYDRTANQAVRIYCHFWKTFDQGEGIDFMNQMNRALGGEASETEMKNFQKRMKTLSDRILKAPQEALFTVTRIHQPPPPSARIFKSGACDQCGEWTMETRLTEQNGKRLCPPCAQPV